MSGPLVPLDTSPASSHLKQFSITLFSITTFLLKKHGNRGRSASLGMSSRLFIFLSSTLTTHLRYTTKELFLAKTKELFLAKARKSVRGLSFLLLFFIFSLLHPQSTCCVANSHHSAPYGILHSLPTFPSPPQTTRWLFGFTSLLALWPQSCALSH